MNIARLHVETLRAYARKNGLKRAWNLVSFFMPELDWATFRLLASSKKPRKRTRKAKR